VGIVPSICGCSAARTDREAPLGMVVGRGRKALGPKVFMTRVMAEKVVVAKIMAVVKGFVSEALEECFRRKAMEKYGYSKGALSKALEKAIELWLELETDETEEEKVNNEAYAKVKDEILQSYRGKYVAIARGKVVASGDSYAEICPIPKGKVSHRLVFKVGEELPRRVSLGWRVSRKEAGLTDK